MTNNVFVANTAISGEIQHIPNKGRADLVFS